MEIDKKKITKEDKRSYLKGEKTEKAKNYQKITPKKPSNQRSKNQSLSKSIKLILQKKP